MKPSKVWLLGCVMLWIIRSFPLLATEEWKILRPEKSIQSEQQYQAFSNEELLRQIEAEIAAGKNAGRHVRKIRAELARRGNEEERRRIFVALYNTVGLEQSAAMDALWVIADREAVFHLGEMLHHPQQTTMSGTTIGHSGKIYESPHWHAESTWKYAARTLRYLLQSTPASGIDPRSLESFDGEWMQLWHDWWRENRPRFQDFFAKKQELEKAIHRIEEVEGLRNKEIAPHTQGGAALMLKAYKRVEMLELRYETDRTLWSPEGTRHVAGLLLNLYDALYPYKSDAAPLYLPQSSYSEHEKWGNHAEITYLPDQSTSDRMALLLLQMENANSLYQQGYDREKWFRVTASRILAMLVTDLIPRFLDFPQTSAHISAETRQQMEDIVRLARFTRFLQSVHNEPIQTPDALVRQVEGLQALLPERINKQREDAHLVLEMIHTCIMYLINEYRGRLQDGATYIHLNSLSRKVSKIFYLYAREDMQFEESAHAELLQSIYAQTERLAAYERSIPVYEMRGSGIYGGEFKVYDCTEGEATLVREINARIVSLLHDYTNEESWWNTRDVGYIASVLLDYYEALSWHQDHHVTVPLRHYMVFPMLRDLEGTEVSGPAPTTEEQVMQKLNRVLRGIQEGNQNDSSEEVTPYDVTVVKNLALLQAVLLPRFLDLPQTQQYLSQEIFQQIEEIVFPSRIIAFLNDLQRDPVRTAEEWGQRVSHLNQLISVDIHPERDGADELVMMLGEGILRLQRPYWKNESLQSLDSTTMLVDLVLRYVETCTVEAISEDIWHGDYTILLRSEEGASQNRYLYYRETKKNVRYMKNMLQRWLKDPAINSQLESLLTDEKMQAVRQLSGL